MHLQCLAIEVTDPQRLEMADGLALGSAGLVDPAGQDERNRHARIGLARLAADQGDFAGWVLLAKGFGGPDASRAGADKNVFHGNGFHWNNRQFYPSGWRMAVFAAWISAALLSCKHRCIFMDGGS